MDAGQRNRIAAVLTTSPHPVAHVARSLLAEFDRLENETGTLRRIVAETAGDVAVAQAAMLWARQDAARLARWIVEHPHPSADAHEVLVLHDRSLV